MLQKKKGLKNPFLVGKSAKIKPTSINNIIAIVNNVIKKMAMFLYYSILALDVNSSYYCYNYCCD